MVGQVWRFKAGLSVIFWPRLLSVDRMETAMYTGRFQDIWIEQCMATRSIKERFGLKDAFDYLVGEKLMTYADAALTRPEFARELPQFVAEVRRIFSAMEIEQHLARIEREDLQEAELAIGEPEDDEAWSESAESIAARRERFIRMKELLTVAHLGTS
jgi:hypothetical protein